MASKILLYEKTPDEKPNALHKLIVMTTNFKKIEDIWLLQHFCSKNRGESGKTWASWIISLSKPYNVDYWLHTITQSNELCSTLTNF